MPRSRQKVVAVCCWLILIFNSLVPQPRAREPIFRRHNFSGFDWSPFYGQDRYLSSSSKDDSRNSVSNLSDARAQPKNFLDAILLQVKSCNSEISFSLSWEQPTGLLTCIQFACGDTFVCCSEPLPSALSFHPS